MRRRCRARINIPVQFSNSLLIQVRHCEEHLRRSNPVLRCGSGLLRFARNDVAPSTTVIPATGSRECAPDDRFRRVSSTPQVPDSIADVSEYWIVRSSRTMTNIGVLAARMRPRFAIRLPSKRRGRRRPSEEEGAGKTGCALHPRSHVQMRIKTHMSIQVQRKQSGLPCAMVLQLISCSPRRDLACLSPSSLGSVSFLGI